MTYTADITFNNGDLLMLEGEDKKLLINSLSEEIMNSYEEIVTITLSTRKD